MDEVCQAQIENVIDKPADEEKWMELEVGADYSICICNFESCQSFYVQVQTEGDLWDELMDLLHDADDLVPMKEILVGKMCLVESKNELHRAKIVRRTETNVMCFCVDNAQLVYFQNEDELIYEIPEKILSIMPAQVVNCRQSGLRSPQSYQWSSILFKRIINPFPQPRMKILKKIDANPELAFLGLDHINSYEVDVYETGLHGEKLSLYDKLLRVQLADINH